MPQYSGPPYLWVLHPQTRRTDCICKCIKSSHCPPQVYKVLPVDRAGKNIKRENETQQCSQNPEPLENELRLRPATCNARGWDPVWLAPGDPTLVFRTSCLRRTPESEVVPLKDDWKPEVTEAFFHFRYLGTVDIFFTDYVRSTCIFKHFENFT